MKVNEDVILFLWTYALFNYYLRVYLDKYMKCRYCKNFKLYSDEYGDCIIGNMKFTMLFYKKQN